MIDFNQLILFFAAVILTTMLVLIGYQTARILQEFRKTIEKMNKVLDDTGVVSESVSKPINLISSLIQNKFKK